MIVRPLAKESTIIQRIHRRCQCFAWKIQAISRAGLPDCLYVGPTKVLWVEYKRIRTAGAPKKLHTFKNMRGMQLHTFKTLLKYNQIVWVTTITPDGLIVQTNLDELLTPIDTANRLITETDYIQLIHNTVGLTNVPPNFDNHRTGPTYHIQQP